MIFKRRFAPLLALSLLAAAPLFPARAADVTEGEVRAVAGASDAFGIDLYDQVKDSSTNVLFSPLSLSTALNMTSLGASGKTADEMLKTLHRPDVANFHLIAGQLLAAFTKSKTVTLLADNQLYVQNGLPILPAFTDKAGKFYHAPANLLDFSNPEAARKTINNAVTKSTAGKIADLLPSGSLTPKSRLVLTSTLYFQGSWENRFPKESTRDEDFRLGADKIVKVPMMHNTAAFPYVQTGDYQAVELPYEGRRLGLLVLVPREGKTLADVEKRLTAEQLQDIGANIAPAKIALSLPRFTATCSLDVGRTLGAMGMPAAFGSDADFSNITGDNSLQLSGVYQKTTVAVDELGTEAAAGSAVAMIEKGIEAAPIRMVVDQPFIMLIIERKSRLVFFMGRVGDPTK